MKLFSLGATWKLEKKNSKALSKLCKETIGIVVLKL